MNNSFRSIDDLLSLNDNSTFERDYKDIYPTELELKKKININSRGFFLDIYIYIEKGEFHTKLFDKQNNFGFDFVRMLLYCTAMSLAKCSMGALEQSFLEFLKKAVKLKIFLVSAPN